MGAPRWLLLALGLPLLAGCVGKAFFSSPAKVANKIERPVRTDARLSVLWVGHATTLVQLDDKQVMTDPVFTSTVGMLSRRLVEPGMSLSAVPPLDLVVVSHMHFDHFSQDTLLALAPRIRVLALPEGGLIYAPNIAAPAVELTTWSSFERGGLRVTAVPVKHNGARWGLDAAWRHYGFTGWVIERNGLVVYFGGDTAFCESCFVETAKRFPHIDLALMPIAPIRPEGIMRHFHVSPSEAVKAFELLGARVMVPIHHGTFVDSFDEAGDALRSLEEARKAAGIAEARVVVLRIGEQRVIIPR